MTSLVAKARAGLAWRVRRLARSGLDRGLPPALLGYRWVGRTTLAEDGARPPSESVQIRTLHPRAEAINPLPRNIASPDLLPDDRGWWGYSMRDVPSRTSDPTILATLRDARVLPFHDPEEDYFRPAILTRKRRSLEVREISFRPVHARLLRSAANALRMESAVWFAERVYDNHSHWLTAHLPKLLLLKEIGLLEKVLLPRKRTAVMDASMRRLGIEPTELRTFEIGQPLDVARLQVLVTDRFRPELLRPVREALERRGPETEPFRRIYISRSRAGRRRLLNEDVIWPLLRNAGFEKVHMEDLDFEGQVDVMRETLALVAPHGAGLTNMMFCPPGTPVLEIADLGFPNPNFYALACAMGHPYWLLDAEAVGDVHPLEKDMRVEPARLEPLLDEMTSEVRASKT